MLCPNCEHVFHSQLGTPIVCTPDPDRFCSTWVIEQNYSLYDKCRHFKQKARGGDLVRTQERKV